MKKNQRLIIGLAVFILGLVFAIYNMHHITNQATQSAASNLSGVTKVVKVDDGDTIEISTGVQKTTIRMIGIDTPEVVDPRKPVQCFGKEASDKAKSIFKIGTVVRLESDPQSGNTDKYGRTLAYVFLPDGTNYNEMMVHDGYAHEYTYRNTPYKYQAQFKLAEAYARDHQLGLWDPATCNGDTIQPAKNSTH